MQTKTSKAKTSEARTYRMTVAGQLFKHLRSLGEVWRPQSLS